MEGNARRTPCPPGTLPPPLCMTPARTLETIEKKRAKRKGRRRRVGHSRKCVVGERNVGVVGVGDETSAITSHHTGNHAVQAVGHEAADALGEAGERVRHGRGDLDGPLPELSELRRDSGGPVLSEGAGRAGTTHLLQVAGRGGVGDAGQEHGEPEEEGARHGAAAFSHFCPF